MHGIKNINCICCLLFLETGKTELGLNVKPGRPKRCSCSERGVRREAMMGQPRGREAKVPLELQHLGDKREKLWIKALSNARWSIGSGTETC